MSKKIIITGASGAFGRVASLALAKKGYQVAGTMRKLGGKNAQVAEELKAAGVILIELDVTDENSVLNGIEKAVQSLGGIDIIFNNAGIGSYGIQELFSVNDMQRVFDVNVFGTQRVMRAVIPHFRRQRRGTIIHTSSLIGRITSPFYGVYSASKWALEAMAENYRTELSGFGIESCIIEPGAMPTDFLDSMLRPSDMPRGSEYGEMADIPDSALRGLQGAITSNEMQRPDRVSEALVSLLELPYGEKPFRTVVDFMGMADPIQKYNNLLSEVTKQIYTFFGTEGMLSLNKEVPSRSI